MQHFPQIEEPVKCLVLVSITFLYILYTPKNRTPWLKIQNTSAPNTKQNCRNGKKKPKKNALPAEKKEENIAIVRSMKCQRLQS